MPLPKVARPVRRTRTTDYYEITMKESQAEVMPGIQTEIWGYDGLYPGPTIKARSGRRVVVRQTNGLGEATSIHTHGAYTDGDSDGHPADLIMPRKYKDYFFGNKQNARTMWYHDHAMDITEAHVTMGLAGFYLIGDKFENRLPLPKGNYDVSIVIQDRQFASDGSFVFGVSSGTPFKNVPVVNGKVQPRFEVERRKYRFRILDGSVARNYDLQLESGEPFTLIASEGGLRETPLEMTSLRITSGERYEIVVDFSKYQVGDQLVLKRLV